MSAEKELIEKFYRAFQQRDYQTMANCYHPDAKFEDEAFKLQGNEIAAMWHMLCERGTDLELSFSVSEQSGKVSAHWEPRYTFSQTGRKVHNIIDAEFEFKDGKIIKHRDQFNFWRWSRQALGTPGLLLGWSSMLQNKVSQMANKSLRSFMKKA
ncbi:nuclear transport factor 2 family protein [Alkalimarinus coralli]|uniref:nuclear transport factor 2 family protein n=1 Tax=Alkalimarinus coralli TaxID=2935863 RepID=UPI00202B4D3A|nr:nuclear transport factor 2 family protein [Alkalimarinus coralli]